MKIEKYEGRGLSRYKTFNRAEFFTNIESAEDAISAFEFARANCKKTFVLGAGSNAFFKNRYIRTFILKNALPTNITHLGGDRFEVSSSVKMLDLLKKMYGERRDACYYLASAPCEVGGALAMNAGTGPREGKCIFGFVEIVKFVRGGKIFEKRAAEIAHSHRNTELSDGDTFVLSAVFRFPPADFDDDPIAARLEWAKENQDLSLPNCGSLCNKYDRRLMAFAGALFRFAPAGLSKKKINWGINKSDNPAWFATFLFTLKALHKIFRKEIRFEIKTVE